jgi:hypothetical protein
MTTLLPAATHQPRPDTADAYEAGVCNIGPAEIAARRRSGHIGAALTVGLLALLLAVDAPPLVRLLVAIPATMSAIGYLQAYLHFCAAYGFWGAFNFGRLGNRQTVTDSHSQARDRRRALQIAVAGMGIGLAVGLLAIAL